MITKHRKDNDGCKTDILQETTDVHLNSHWTTGFAWENFGLNYNLIKILNRDFDLKKQ